MVNSTSYDMASRPVSINSDVLYVSLISLMVVFFSLFLCFMAIMLNVFFTTSHMQEEPRYILFVHMLINDTVYTFLGFFVFFNSIYRMYYPVPFCYIIVMASSTAFKVTPYNLAVMSLERYVAICFPLRHAEWCNRQKANLTIVVIWIIGLVPNMADFMILCFSVRSDFFFLYCICARSEFMKSGAQDTLRNLTHILSFSLVGLIIVSTYIKIMLVAKKLNSGKAVASKAGKTVILHAVQLLLCMTSFSYNLLEIYLKKYLLLLPTINFFFFMCLPRFISPLIYGLRDEVFLKGIKRLVFRKPLTTFPNLGKA